MRLHHEPLQDLLARLHMKGGHPGASHRNVVPGQQRTHVFDDRLESGLRRRRELRKTSGEDLGRRPRSGFIGTRQHQPPAVLLNDDGDTSFARHQPFESHLAEGQSGFFDSVAADQDRPRTRRALSFDGKVHCHRFETEPHRHVGSGGDLRRGRAIGEKDSGVDEIDDAISIAILQQRSLGKERLQTGLDALLGRLAPTEAPGEQGGNEHARKTPSFFNHWRILSVEVRVPNGGRRTRPACGEGTQHSALAATSRGARWVQKAKSKSLPSRMSFSASRERSPDNRALEFRLS